MKPLLICLVVISGWLAGAQTAPATSATAVTAGRYLYRASLVQAAPGKLVELIDLYKAKFAREQKLGEPATFWMRHSQGDRWDLLLLAPMGSYSEYFGTEHVRRLGGNAAPEADAMAGDIAWQEDVFVYGPPLPEVRKAFDGAGFFHVEMFVSLPGRQAELKHERDMENAYASAIGQPRNMIFVRDQGAAWDLFTIGCFRDLKHYAEGPAAGVDTEAAAKAAGFESAAAIGPYLRRFISLHHDTLAVAVK